MPYQFKVNRYKQNQVTMSTITDRLLYTVIDKLPKQRTFMSVV